MTGDIQLIDTHLHLHLAQFDADREQAITRAQAVQVDRLIEVGYDEWPKIPASCAAI